MSAQAAQYDNEDLGKAMPMWTENFPDLNHAGDAVWTGWDGHLGATAWFLSGDRSQKIQLPALYTNSGAWARAFALSIRNEYPTNSCKSFSAGCDVWAIGSSSSSARMLDRRAVAWHIGKIDTTNGTLLAPGTLDLHAMAGGSERVSAAYGLTSVWGQSGHAYIAGFVRERVANDRLAVPTTWFANVGGAVPSITATALGTPAGGQPYGMATGVASVHKSGGKLLICGTVGVSGSYAHALCWEKSGSAWPYKATNHIPVDSLPNLPSGTNLLTSIVTRVRSVDLPGVNQSVMMVVGLAMDDQSRWYGWVYDWTNKRFVAGGSDLALNASGAADTMVYDVASWVYPDVNVTSNSNVNGLRIAGVSGTVQPTPPSGTLGPTSVDTSTLRATEYRALLNANKVPTTTLVCTADEDTQYLSTQSPMMQTVALIPNDQQRRYAALEEWRTPDRRLAVDSAGHIYRQTRIPNAGTTTVNERSVQFRHREDEARGPLLYHHAVTARTGDNSGVTEALLRTGSTLSCESVDTVFPLLPSFAKPCTNASLATFDIHGGTQIRLNTITTDNQHLRSTKQSGSFTPYTYAQTAYQTPSGSEAMCRLSRVETPTKIVNPNKDHPDDTADWRHCGSGSATNYNTDIRSDYDNCNGCGIKGINNYSACSIGRCEDWTLTTEAKPYNTQGSNKSCWITDSYDLNDGYCQPNGQVEVTHNMRNYCRKCEASTTTDGWTTSTIPSNFYQCTAHAASDYSSTGSGTKNLNGYTTAHLCANTTTDTSANTTNAESNYWRKDGGPRTLRNWVTDFYPITYRASSPLRYRNIYDNTPPTRTWVLDSNIRYLGQMNANPYRTHPYDGMPYQFGKQPTSLNLKPGQTEWLAFYYNDRDTESSNRGDQQNRIGVLLQYDNEEQDIEADIMFMCARDGRAGYPIPYGFRYCGANGGSTYLTAHGDTGRPVNPDYNTYGIECKHDLTEPIPARRDGGSGWLRYRNIACSSDTWVEEHDLPWSWREYKSGSLQPDTFGTDVPANWGSSQGGIYIEGHVDCGRSPRQAVYNRPWKGDTNANPADNEDIQDETKGKGYGGPVQTQVKESNGGNGEWDELSAFEGRSGWVFIKVHRKSAAEGSTKTRDDVCTPVTMRATWFRHDLGDSCYPVGPLFPSSPGNTSTGVMNSPCFDKCWQTEDRL